MTALALVCLLTLPRLASAQLELLTDEVIQTAFPGTARRVQLVFRNPTDRLVEVQLRSKLLQASSATAIPLGETAWKKLQVLPGQTVLETARLDFPVVKAPARFIIQWVYEDRRVLGKTDVMVYPTNLLEELKTIAGEKPFAVLDPGNQLKPLLQGLKLEFDDLERMELENFTGALALFGPFASKQQMPPRLAERITKRCAGGLNAVWLRPPKGRLPDFEPSFYPVCVGRGMVVVAQAGMVAGLAENPSAQLNLIRLAQMAVKAEPFALPELNPQSEN